MSKITPLKAIRARCIACSGFELKRIRECPFDGITDERCPLYSLRMGKGSRATLKHIRSYCLWCCNDQRNEVRLCTAVQCPLWMYRFGKRPKRPKITLNPSLLMEILTTEEVLADKV